MIPLAWEDELGSPGAADSSLMHTSMGFLCHRCSEETELFFQHKAHDPRYCYELFRRAIAQRDELAWNCLYHRYEKLVIGWVERNSLFHMLGEDAEVLVNAAFIKMWQGLTPEKFSNFPDLKSILRYLQMCAHSTLVDLARAAERQQRLSIEELAETDGDSRDEQDQRFVAAPCIEDEVFYSVEAADLWRMLQSRLKSEKERCVIYGMFVLALKPSELKVVYPDTFRDVREVYLVRDNLIARLRRDSDIRRFYDGENS